MIYEIEDPVKRQEIQEKVNKAKWMKRGFRIGALTTVLGVAFFSYPDISPAPEGYSQYTQAWRTHSNLKRRVSNREIKAPTFEYNTLETDKYSHLLLLNNAEEDSALAKAINSLESDVKEMEKAHPEFRKHAKDTGKQFYDFVVNLALAGTAGFGLWIVGGDMYRRKEEKYKDILTREKEEPLVME